MATDARDVDCETCGAAAGEQCMSTTGPGIIAKAHPGRLAAAKLAG